MALRYPSEWKFAGPDEIPALSPIVAGHFFRLLTDVAATAENPWSEVERFKRKFGAMFQSSDSGWAETDLLSAMQSRVANSVNFIESLWLALEDAQARGLKIPSAKQVNARLLEHGVPFRIQDGELQRIHADAAIAAAHVEGLATSSHGMPYQLGAPIGQGGFGVVYRATRQTSVATFEYALKVLDPSAFLASDKALPRFQREVRAVQALQHRAIVPYVDAGVDFQGRPYLVMPLINGIDIRTATEGAEPSTVISLMAEVLHGLDHAHGSNVLHRDLKPSNVLVRASDMQPVILDFGTAYIIDDIDSKSLTTAAVGSIGYIPSEVLAEPKIRSVLQDVFACAVITYELIARRRPDPQQYIPLATHRPELAFLDECLVQALGPASGRPATAAAFRSALLAVVIPQSESPKVAPARPRQISIDTNPPVKIMPPKK
jgi:Protein kinase domain